VDELGPEWAQWAWPPSIEVVASPSHQQIAVIWLRRGAAMVKETREAGRVWGSDWEGKRELRQVNPRYWFRWAWPIRVRAGRVERSATKE
jgi:hypothetical protein